MNNQAAFVSLSEWFSSQEKPRAPINALADFVAYLCQRGYTSLETAFSELFQAFLSQSISQIDVLGDKAADVYRRTPTVYVTCLRKEQSLIFLDIELVDVLAEDVERSHGLELDVFGENKAVACEMREELIELAMKFLA